MDVTLYGLDISHPSRAAALMLGHKGIPYRYAAMPPGTQPLLLRARGFRGATVPALRVGGHRVQGSVRIARELERIHPEPPLYPADPEARRAVEAAEEWGDRVYQPVPREVFRWALAQDPSVREFLAAMLGLPAPQLSGRMFIPAARYFAGSTGATDERIERHVRELPSHLAHVDELLAAGTIGGDALNAADFQIATTTRLLLRVAPLSELAEGRPAAEHAMRVCPDFDGDPVTIALPRDPG